MICWKRDTHPSIKDGLIIHNKYERKINTVNQEKQTEVTERLYLGWLIKL